MIKYLLLFFFTMNASICAYPQSPLSKLWDFRFGGTSGERLNCLEKTFDNGFVLGGYSNSGISGDKTQPCWGLNDYWMVKIDSIGILQWDKRFGGTDRDYLYSLKQTSEGGFILGGSSKSDANGDKSQPNWDTTFSTVDYWIVKLDSLGYKQWDKRFGGTNIDELSELQQTMDNGYILGGYSYSGMDGDKTQANWDLQGFTADYWIVKTDSLGIKEWDKRFGGNENEFLCCIQQTSDSGFILGGDSYSDISGDKTQANWFNPGFRDDYWIVKTDMLGNKQWDKRFGGYEFEYLKSIEQTNDGGYILGGFSLSGANGDKSQLSWGSYDIWIVKIDSLGIKQWDKRFGGSGAEEIFKISKTKNNGFLLSGESYSNISGDKTENNLGIEQNWIVKTDSLGIMEWDKTIFTNGHDEQALTIETNDGCFVTSNYTDAGIGGYKTQPSWGFNDFWIAKFCDTTTTGIHQISKDEIIVYPNPFLDHVSITFPKQSSINKYFEIINVFGQVIVKNQLENQNYSQIIELNYLQKGIYFLHIFLDGERVVKKIIKE